MIQSIFGVYLPIRFVEEKMIIIKRYPNRKLYNTELKQYITLEGVADLIRQGNEITVIDHATGDDLTSLTLTQIILEEEKKQGGFIPRSFLAGIIRAGNDRLSSFQRALATQLSFLHQFEEELIRRVQDLVRKGELSDHEGQSYIINLLNQNPSPTLRLVSDEDIEQVIIKMQLPTSNDFKRVADQLDALSAKLDELNR
jgi:polyhydroxyalkanoate synthesis repressor PhaR